MKPDYEKMVVEAQLRILQEIQRTVKTLGANADEGLLNFLSRLLCANAIGLGVSRDVLVVNVAADYDYYAARRDHIADSETCKTL